MKRLSILFAGMALAAVAAGPASAATSTVTGTVTAGSLGIATSATPTFGVTLDGTDQVAWYTVPTTVTDATGSSSGWNLTVTSTQFTTGSLTLATTASTLTGVSNSCVGGSTCTDPTNGISYALTVPAGSTPPTPVKYFNAAATTGAGRFTNTPTINVAVPANTRAGVYSSTLTLAAVSGP
jgi:WxL domain surface cell wall-binding